MTSTTNTQTQVDDGAVEWHQMSAIEVLDAQDTSVDGLRGERASERLESTGRNELVDNGSTHPLRIVWDQISAVMVLILIGAALLSLLLGKYLEAGAIGAIVVLFTLLGFFQEYRAERAIDALRKMSVSVVKVRRDGRLIEVGAAELVPGDVVGLEAGSVVPADIRLIEVANLRIEEAALTGESEPVDKHIDAISGSNVALGDRRCLAFSGTQVAAGRGVGVVVATGMNTELGRIATLLQNVQVDDTPLQERLDRVGKQLALVGVAVAGLVVLMGAISGESASDLVLTAISVAVAVIPEGLPAVVTFTLAIGAQRMLRRNALIRKLPAVETLGSVTVICSDKTGTLTQNKMTVTRVHVADARRDVVPGQQLDLSTWTAEERLLVGAVVLCNDGEVQIDIDGRPAMIGDPTETALLQLVVDAGMHVVDIRTGVRRVGENPFDSTRKRMSTLHGPIAVAGSIGDLFGGVDTGGHVAYAKGAIDSLVGVADKVHTAKGVVALDDEHRQRLLATNDEMAAGGLRVLGVGYRSFEPANSDIAEMVAGAESSLTIIGLVGIIDPPRSEVRDAVRLCRAAGIRPVMITGDHPLTAKAIAHQLGIATDERVLTGNDLDELNDTEFDTAAREVSVFARVSPEHKLRIVKSLQSQAQVVAMTGDGVNDAPALKQADIGVAMGITGTDVSKEASDMVLRDDNFATIVAAVEEGRVIYDNLRRFVSFAVAGNLGKIIVMLGWPIPYLLAGGNVDAAIALLPLQLLWLNLMTDGLLGLSMGVEPAEPTVMQRPPQRPGASLWADGLGRRSLVIGTLIGIASLAVGFAYRETGQDEWQTMIFTTLAFMQVFQAFGTRSRTESIRTIGWNTNRVMLAIGGVVVALQLAALYTPLNEFLDLDPLGAVDLAVCVGLGVLLFVVLEVAKTRTRRATRNTPTTADQPSASLTTPYQEVSP
ncbi:MAG: cation-translocating P-type ATPase [Ilumatobacter sp.]|uniref:cation-translocating P-type ATPase n=1 Tax=Ilumatobacter sp. TaxID=1967498 RepID=UPI003296D465